jgi:tetrachlorobenzoquinone reductase
MSQQELSVRVESIVETGPAGPGRVRIFDLRPLAGPALPAFEAGAHIDIAVRDGLLRQYSLMNAPGETHRYVVAVGLDAASRGGSRHLHEHVSAGDVLRISAPRCRFALVEDAPFSVLIAGGIGVTPLWAMAQRLIALGLPFAFYFGARSEEAAPLLDRIAPALAAANKPLVTAFETDNGARLDLAAIMQDAPAGAHFYACGPAGMLDAYIAAAAGIAPTRVHYERFSTVAEEARDGGFEVNLARTGKTISVAPGQTILEALKLAGVNANHSCTEGICGACETPVLEGVADHRDSVLTDAEKAAGKTMMICCSGARTARLVLDI